MSTPTMNHSSHTHQQQEQQQLQQINEMQHAHLNLVNSPHVTLTRSDSTSTVILEEEETRLCHRNVPPTHPPSAQVDWSILLRSFLKTGGQFNKDLESSDKLNEIFASGNEFALQKLLSEVNVNDVNIDMNEFMKINPVKLFDSRTLSDFLRSESFDQLIALTANNTDVLTNPPAITCSTESFSELRAVSPELITNNMLHAQSNQLIMEHDNSLQYTQMNSFDSSISMSPQISYNEGALNAFEHDHAFLSKRTPAIDTSISTNSKRTRTCESRRTSSRLQSRAKCLSPCESNSIKMKRTHNISRATDIKTPDDLSYYLERRRKNNEASKMSRAARKEKFGNMDQQCNEYQRVNTELRAKIASLETVTTILKNGLVNNFQRKNSV